MAKNTLWEYTNTPWYTRSKENPKVYVEHDIYSHKYFMSVTGVGQVLGYKQRSKAAKVGHDDWYGSAATYKWYKRINITTDNVMLRII